MSLQILKANPNKVYVIDDKTHRHYDLVVIDHENILLDIVYGVIDNSFNFNPVTKTGTIEALFFDNNVHEVFSHEPIYNDIKDNKLEDIKPLMAVSPKRISKYLDKQQKLLLNKYFRERL